MRQTSLIFNAIKHTTLIKHFLLWFLQLIKKSEQKNPHFDSSFCHQFYTWLKVKLATLADKMKLKTENVSCPSLTIQMSHACVSLKFPLTGGNPDVFNGMKLFIRKSPDLGWCSKKKCGSVQQFVAFLFQVIPPAGPSIHRSTGDGLGRNPLRYAFGLKLFIVVFKRLL